MQLQDVHATRLQVHMTQELLVAAHSHCVPTLLLQVVAERWGSAAALTASLTQGQAAPGMRPGDGSEHVGKPFCGPLHC